MENRGFSFYWVELCVEEMLTLERIMSWAFGLMEKSWLGIVFFSFTQCDAHCLNWFLIDSPINSLIEAQFKLYSIILKFLEHELLRYWSGVNRKSRVRPNHKGLCQYCCLVSGFSWMNLMEAVINILEIAVWFHYFTHWIALHFEIVNLCNPWLGRVEISIPLVLKVLKF